MTKYKESGARFPEKKNLLKSDVLLTLLKKNSKINSSEIVNIQRVIICITLKKLPKY